MRTLVSAVFADQAAAQEPGLTDRSLKRPKHFRRDEQQRANKRLAIRISETDVSNGSTKNVPTNCQRDRKTKNLKKFEFYQLVTSFF